MGKKDGRARHLFLYGRRPQVAAGPNDGATLCSPCPGRDRHDKRLSRYQIDSLRARRLGGGLEGEAFPDYFPPYLRSYIYTDHLRAIP